MIVDAFVALDFRPPLPFLLSLELSLDQCLGGGMTIGRSGRWTSGQRTTHSSRRHRQTWIDTTSARKTAGKKRKIPARRDS